MKALIVEKEMYLAQGIASKLADLGYECEIISTVDEAFGTNSYDVILLAHSTVNHYAELIIKHHRNAIIVMIINYISDDTVTKPLNAGAVDYILKPFIVDELIRKIKHYAEHKKMAEKLHFLEGYLSNLQSDMNIPEPNMATPLPFLIKSYLNITADLYAIKYARLRNLSLDFISMQNTSLKEISLLDRHHSKIYYITHIEELKKPAREELFKLTAKLPVILSIVTQDSVEYNNVVDLLCISQNLSFMGDIISIKEYEQIVISKFQDKYPDVELAKRLGVSRKSLWEKRKKYGINRNRGNK